MGAWVVINAGWYHLSVASHRNGCNFRPKPTAIVEQLGINRTPCTVDTAVELRTSGRHQPQPLAHGADRQARGDLPIELGSVAARDHRNIDHGQQTRERRPHFSR
jgi:hypothetical protein